MEFPPASGRTAFENFPVMGAVNRPSGGGFANTVVVNFPAAGAYPYELDYTECCPSRMILQMYVKSGPVAKPLPPTVAMTMSPDRTAVDLGGSTTLTLTTRDASGNGVPNLPVRMRVSGANPREFTVTTNATGVVSIPYTGANGGRDYVQGVATFAGMALFSNTTEIRNGVDVNTPPATPGLIKSPENGSVITAPTPIVSFGSLGGGSLEVYPVSNPSDVRVISTRVEGGSNGTVLGVFDPTTLANGEYVIRYNHPVTSRVNVRVVGENKIGRMRATVTDFTVPLSGIPITIGRTYDSLERGRVGDFGYGWDLEIGGAKLEVNTFGDVTFTMGGKRQTFHLRPRSSGFPFPYWLTPEYAPEPGTYGSLTAGGACPVVISGGSGFGGTGFVRFPETVTPYAPASYTYTAPDGTQYKMLANGKLESIRDLSGNTLTFTANGITSTAGNVTIPFVRDGNGRITEIRDVAAPNPNVWRYVYNAAGDLERVTLPVVTTPVLYEYATGHYLTKETDPRGQSAQSTFGADGKLLTVRTAAGEQTSWTYAWDATAQVMTTRQTNPDGGVEITETDAVGNRIKFTDGLNRVRTYTYDANRNLLTETDPAGQLWRHTYDAKGFRTSTRDPLGNTQATEYNQFGGPTRITDGAGNQRTVAYDAAFRPLTITDSIGQVAELTYDATGNVLTMRDANQKVTRFTYNARGDVLTRVDPLNRTTTFTYDAMGRKLTEADPRGNTTRWEYDGLSRITKVTDAKGGISRTVYDASGNKVEEYDALNRLTRHSYDPLDRVSTTTFADTTTMSYLYDFRGNKTQVTDQSGRRTTHEYDAAGQLRKTNFAVGTAVAASMSYEYEARGKKSREVDERGFATAWSYDNAGRMTKVTDGVGRMTENVYDGANRRTRMIDPALRATRYGYDPRNRLTTVTHADETTTQYGYDGMGRQTSMKDQANRVTQKGYDDAGQLTSVTDALNQVTRYTYDPSGNLATQVDAEGRTTSYLWDELNRRTRRTLPMAMQETAVYDAVGNMTSRVDFNGRTTGYQYDALNRLQRKTPDASFFAGPVQYTYTPTGKRATMSDASGNAGYSYDARDRLVTKTAPAGVLNYGYDAHGNVASIVSGNVNGTTVSYTWDGLNRLATVADNRLGGATTSYAYDPSGTLGSMTYPNGVRHGFVYDSLDRLRSLPVTGAGTLDQHDYTVGPTGHRLTALRLGGRTSTYGYDSTYKLTQEAIAGDPVGANNGVLSYGYDRVGNRLSLASTLGAIGSRTYTYDNNDRLGGDTYDNNGNTLTSGGVSYLYDFEDRLLAANGATFLYDGNGVRVAKTVAGNITRYLVDDLNPTGYSQVVDELLGGVVQRTFSYGTQRISQNWPVPAMVVNYYGYDGHGSVRTLTDSAGAVTDRYEYDAFGSLVASSGSTANQMLYAGEQFDPTVGMYYLRARWYRAVTGRFVTADTFEGVNGQPLSQHKYVYAHGNPVMGRDPSGNATVMEAAFLSGAILLTAAVADNLLPKTQIDGHYFTPMGSLVYCIMKRAISNLDHALGRTSVSGVCTFPIFRIWEKPWERDRPRIKPVPAPDEPGPNDGDPGCNDEERAKSWPTCLLLYEKFCIGTDCGGCLRFCWRNCYWPFHKEKECRTKQFPDQNLRDLDPVGPIQ